MLVQHNPPQRVLKPVVPVHATPSPSAHDPAFGPEAFDAGSETALRWLGMAGFLINSRGTTLMVDPLLGGFDMPVMIEFPIAASDVPRLDAVLVRTVTTTTTAFPLVAISLV